MMMASATRSVLFAALLPAFMAGSAGCATTMKEPLGTERLQERTKDPRVSVVLVRFRTEGRPPTGSDFSEKLFGHYFEWIFAVANETTGWSFRRLLPSGQIFRTGHDALEPDPKNTGAGWLTFLVPSGTSYIATTAFGTPGASYGFALRDPYYVVTPRPDRILLEDTGRWKKVSELRAEELMDFIDEPRFAVQVAEPQSVVYAGTIVCTIKCTTDSLSRCPHELTVVDESGLARSFVNRYRSRFPAGWPLRTRLLTIPQSRTIEIRDGTAGQELFTR